KIITITNSMPIPINHTGNERLWSDVGDNGTAGGIASAGDSDCADFRVGGMRGISGFSCVCVKLMLSAICSDTVRPDTSRFGGVIPGGRGGNSAVASTSGVIFNASSSAEMNAVAV